MLTLRQALPAAVMMLVGVVAKAVVLSPPPQEANAAIATLPKIQRSVGAWLAAMSSCASGRRLAGLRYAAGRQRASKTFIAEVE